MRLLDIEGIVGGYATAEHIVKAVSLSADAGEVVTIIGGNGAGKSTTLKTVSGVSELLKTVEGEITFLAHALSRRSGISAQTAMDELLSGELRAMALLRAAAVSRHVAASVLAGVGDLLGMPDPGRAIDVYDKLSDADVEDSRTWLTADPAYRRAVGRLEFGRG